MNLIFPIWWCRYLPWCWEGWSGYRRRMKKIEILFDECDSHICRVRERERESIANSSHIVMLIRIQSLPTNQSTYQPYYTHKQHHISISKISNQTFCLWETIVSVCYILYNISSFRVRSKVQYTLFHFMQETSLFHWIQTIISNIIIE